MGKISSIYKTKVTKESFKSIVEHQDANPVMNKLLQKYMQRQEKLNPKIRLNKTEKEKANSKGISLLVAKFENIFTNPDSEYIKQEDPPEIDNVRIANQVEGEGIEKAEPYMYFIRNGRYSVHVRDNFVTKTTTTNEEDDKQDRDRYLVRELYDGDHFGEIGVIFGNKRTATVRSENYGTLARLNKSSYQEMLKTFDSMTTLFKQNMFKYNDKILRFIELEMDKIAYFRLLTMKTKQELIFSMERVTFKKGDYICQQDEIVEKMYLIQDGVVEIAIPYDKRVEDELFVIERLTKGAIINHRSFLLKDDADTDFKCATTVSAFVLNYDKVKQVKKYRPDLQTAKNQVKLQVFKSFEPIALDYIIHNHQHHSTAAYNEQLVKNELRVDFKNTVMQTWSKVKKENSKPSLQDMVNQLMKKKREEQDNQNNDEAQKAK